MTTLKASRLKAALDKARNAGQVEEAITVTGMPLVVRSLTAEEYGEVLAELKNTTEEEYYSHYQIEHVCRAIIEIDGESLRDADFIELDEGSKVERHQWLKDNVISTWSREVLYVVFRKVCEVIAAAEAKASEGVTFQIESETDEEKYRRLIGEMKEIGDDLPEEMRAAILKEEGLMSSTSKADLEAIDERTRTWEAPPEADPEEPETTAPEPPPVRAPQQIVRAAVPADPMAATEPPPAETAPPTRVPLNQTPIRDPVPVNPADHNTQPANRRSPRPPPEAVHDLSAKSARFAAIEGLEDDPDARVIRREPKTNPEEARTIINKPPVGGRNAKFVNPNARGKGLDPRARR